MKPCHILSMNEALVHTILNSHEVVLSAVRNFSCPGVMQQHVNYKRPGPAFKLRESARAISSSTNCDNISQTVQYA